jgi:hypothetical protein
MQHRARAHLEHVGVSSSSAALAFAGWKGPRAENFHGRLRAAVHEHFGFFLVRKRARRRGWLALSHCQRCRCEAVARC